MRARLAPMLLVAGACSRSPAPMMVVRPAPMPAPLPALVVEPLPSRMPLPRTARMDTASRPHEKRISLTATNADVRGLLIAIAEAGDIDLVLSADVKGRASVNLKDVPASEALRAVLAEAGLGIVSERGMILPWDPVVVFYDLAVNIDRLSAEAIMRRYGVGREVAEAVVRARSPTPFF